MVKSIKNRLAFYVVTIVFLVTLTINLLAHREHAQLDLDEKKSHLYAIAESTRQHLQPIFERQSLNYFDLKKIEERLQPFGEIIYVKIYSVNYKLVYEFKGRASKFYQQDFIQDSLHPPANQFGISTVHNSALLCQVPIGAQDEALGYLLIATTIEDSSSHTEQMIRMFFVSIIITAIYSVVSILLFRRVLAPFSLLSKFTAQVNLKKDYSMRFLNKENKEVNELAYNVNQLLSTIETELIINQDQNQALLDQQQTMLRLANYDNLTGLPNRQYVMDSLRVELANAKQHNQDITLMYFDLDGFKGINDSLGHETGDLILIEVAERVQSILRMGDVLARLGGDEFLVIPDKDANEASIINVANRILASFNEPFHLRGLSLNLGVSIGIAKGSDAEFQLSQLISNADLAMYRSKSDGRGRYTLFNKEMVIAHRRKMEIANSIEQAIRDNQFFVTYQPKISIHGDVIGYEALLRWSHPTMGLISSAEFIPIAEQGGKITSITKWIIEAVSNDMGTFNHHFDAEFKIGINLSAHDLRDIELFETIHQIFVQYDVNPDFIEFEVTESAYLESFESSNKFFKRISNMGCSIALDDFGTGYSSLSYLTQIQIDSLKIDRQFIRELESSERSRLVTSTIIDLAKRLSLTICAEGIEDEFQLKYIQSLGCDTMQGYMFSKPLPLDEVLTLPKRYTLTSSKF